MRMKVIKHTYTDEFVKEEDVVIHMAHCGEWVDSQDAVAIDILFEKDEIELCAKCQEKTDSK